MKYLSAPLKAALIVATVLALHAGILVAAQFTHIDFGDANGTGTSRISILLVLFSTPYVLTTFATLVYAGVVSRKRDILYWPILLVSGPFALYLIYAAIPATDALIHGLKPRWHVTDEPEIRVYATLLFFVMMAGLTWKGILFLLGIGWSVRRIIAIYCTLTVVVVLGIAAAFGFAQLGVI